MKKKVNVLNILARYAIILALVLLVIVFWSSSDTFFTENNIFNIFKQVAVVGIVSVGMTMVLLTGGIDLSVGSTIGVACVLTATLLLAGVNAILAVIITLIACTAIGMLNGFFVNVLKIPPLITTLGMMTSLRGAAYLINGRPADIRF